VGGFYDGLLGFLRHTVSSGFLEQAQLDNLHVGTDADELLGRLHGACLKATGLDSYRDI
jgi:predicted Rossmann-fold nucleotide-binding protein